MSIIIKRNRNQSKLYVLQKFEITAPFKKLYKVHTSFYIMFDKIIYGHLTNN